MPALAQGLRLGRFEIKSQLGAGAMGEVYLAQDTRLGRKVALKLLSSEVTGNNDRLQRFEQEARAASALNHPNILTIHEIGVENGAHFIATEFIDGVTLRQQMKTTDLTPAEAIDVAIQTASALEAAHAAGIVHRDIKPENIMLRRDSIVKVLDFGLAKLTEQKEAMSSNPEAETVQLLRTAPGSVMGTVEYMSPEQARGKEVDERTDIWSLGVVIYEMVAAQRPFQGETKSDVFAAILTTEPPLLSNYIETVPEELQRIVKKALRPRKEERYQSVKDMVVDLRNLKNDLEFADKLNRHTADKLSVRTAQRASDAPEVLPRQFPMRYLLVGVPILTLVALGAWWLFGNRSSNVDSAFSPRTSEVFSWSSTPGEVYSIGSFSPDGRMIAFASTKNGSKNIWIKPTAAGEPIQISKDEFGNDSPIWSPSGDEVAFYSRRGDQNGVWRMPFSGGATSLIATVGQHSPRLRYWSKSGTIYYESQQNLFALELASGQSRQLTNFGSVKANANTISISPDEQTVVFVSTGEDGRSRLYQIPVSGGSPQAIAEDSSELRNTAWHPDGKRIFYSARVDGTYQVFAVGIDNQKSSQITFGENDSLVLDVSEDGTRVLYGSSKEESDVWGVDVAKAEEFSVTHDLTSELWPSVSRDGKTVAFQSVRNLSQGDKIFNCTIRTVPIGQDAEPSQLTADGFLPTWSPDGKQLAFMRVIGKTYSLWTVPPIGGREIQLTSGGLPSVEFSPLPYNRVQVSPFSWSPDSSRIAYISNRSGQRNVWTVGVDGSNDRQLSGNTDSNVFVYSPLWSSDGKRIAFSSRTDKASADKKIVFKLWITDLDKQESRAVFETDSFVRLLGWSHGDKDLVFASSKTRSASPAEVKLAQVSTAGGADRSLAVLDAAYLFNTHLSADGKLIAFTAHRDGKDNLWLLPSSGGEAKKLTANNDSRLYFSSLAWSSDAKAIYFAKQSRHSLLSMITNFK